MTKKEQFENICMELRVNIKLIKKYVNEGNIELAIDFSLRLKAQLDLLDVMDIINSHNKWIIMKYVLKIFD